MSGDPKGSSDNSTFIGLLSRVPGGILGGLGLVSLLSGAIELHSGVLKIVTAYQSITQPVWDLLIGWLFRWLDWPFPWWVKDYLTMGVISAAASFRASIPLVKQSPMLRRARLTATIFAGLFWPIDMIGNATLYFRRSEVGQFVGIFFDFLMWALIIIAISYGLIFANST